ncbi:MAG: radical SAM protein [Desulfobacteraceae bacterium]|nr:MAG: radical SAM protein [Desulfobacteraceae bacterium]
MSNGLLINYAGVPHEMSSLFPDNGLAALAGVLQEANQMVRILDFSTTETIHEVYSSDIRKALRSLAPKIFGGGRLDDLEIADLRQIDSEIQVSESAFIHRIIDELNNDIVKNKVIWAGFKLWMGSIRQSMEIAAALKKKNPGLKIFGGGPCVDIFQHAILKKYPFIDALVFAEGEKALPLLIEWAEGKGDLFSIPNILYSNGRDIVSNPIERIKNLDKQPFPIYDPDIYPAMEGDRKMKILCFDDSRGCPMGCAFCPGTNKFGTTRIEKSSDRCIAELSYLKEKYDVRYFRFSGSNTSAKLLNEVAEKLIAKKLDILFAVFSSATGLSAESVHKLATAGLYSIFVGIESANHFQRKNHLGKKLSLDGLKDVFEACRQSGVFISTSMIYPAPFSNRKILEENINFLVDGLKGYENCSVALYPAGLYPYTKWFDHMESFGFSIECPSKEAYIEETLDYRYNIVLPRYLWKELPYTLNGKSFKEMLMETNTLAEALKAHGILPYLVEANVMMAPVLGYRHYKEFALESSIAFFGGDAERLEAWNREFNRAQMTK